MKRIKWISGLVTILVTAFALTTWAGPILAGGPGNKPATGAEIRIDNFRFDPAIVTISAGTTITWTNNDDVPHVVASDDKVFKSNALDTDDRFSFTFTKPGTYNYYCAIHPKMTATIVVQ
jgi:plastocyanin